MTVDDVLAQVEYTKRRYGGGVPLTYAFADDVLFPDRDAQLRRRSNTTAELLAALDYICVNSYGRGQDGDPASSYFNLTRSGRGAEYPVATQVGQIVSHFERFRAFLAESAIERPVVLSETGRQSGHYAGLSLADAHLFNRNIDGWVQIQQQSKSPAVDGLFYFVLSDAAYKQSQGASPRACPACPACPVGITPSSNGACSWASPHRPTCAVQTALANLASAICGASTRWATTTGSAGTSSRAWTRSRWNLRSLRNQTCSDSQMPYGTTCVTLARHYPSSEPTQSPCPVGRQLSA